MNKSKNTSRNSDIGVLASFNGLGTINPFRVCINDIEYNVKEILYKKDNHYAAMQSISFVCRLDDDQVKEIIYFVTTHCWKCRDIILDSNHINH
ncbi:hypothetical protein [Anaeromicropila herbilytica]|uniref:Uncharacterized protein n=1 Tax=Anaeromicropila herbilytica TaxID=2785025 RepID=A0A7R7EK92_9FIRM|nr:hypothetical protein [Anaeromicropila herbilytica]BCN30313.1 hypothetical protein bsdtb5_16080 [Anaeromicropila herbilytica]